MVDLIARTPLDGLSETIGDVTLAETPPRHLTLIAPLRGQEAALEAALGCAVPAPGQTVACQGGTLIWTGPGQAMLLDAVMPQTQAAACTDQTDGWAGLTLSGAHAADVLARLTPLDLRTAQFAPGQTARTMLQHMTCVLTRIEDQTFHILVFRSMARTAAAEITHAMHAHAARQAL